MPHELKNKFVYQSVTSVSQVLLPLISYPYITRILGPDNLGKINYVDFLAQMFMIFAAFGIPFYGVREIARVREHASKRTALLKELSLLLSFFSALSVCVYILLTYPNWAGNSRVYLFGMFNIILSSFSFDWYIQGMEEFRFIAVRSLLVRVGMLVAFFVFVKHSGDYPVYYLIFTIGFFVIAIMNISKIVSENSFTKQPLNYKQHLVPLWHFFLTSSAISIYIYFDTILLKLITQSDAAVGYYTLPLKIVKICQLALLSAGMVLLPRLSFLAGSDNISAIKIYLNKLFNMLVTAGLPVCAGIFLLAPEIIHVIAGEKFIPAVPVLRILSFLPFIIGLSNLFAFQILVPFKKEKKFLAAVIAGCLVSVGINLLLIPGLSEQGAAYANLTTEILITVITGVYAFKTIRFNTNITLVIQSAACILFFIPAILFARYLFASSLAVLCAGIVACTVLYFCLQHFIFKNSFTREMQQYVSAVFFSKK